jgi:ABC-2 type transport system permease protein
MIREFTSIVHMTIKTSLAYRSALLLGILSTSVSIIIFYFLWRVVFDDAQYIRGFTFPMMVTYVILSRVIAGQFAGGINGTIASHIQYGSIAVELLRPISFMRLMLMKRLGEFVQYIFSRAIPVTFTAALVFGIMPPVNITALLLFFISIFVGIIILYFVEFMVGLISFYTLDFYGVLFAKTALLTLLSGAVVPFAMFPAGLANVLELLPFQFIVHTPVSIYMGLISGNEALIAIGFQVIWVGILWMLAALFYSIAIKKVVVQGG